MPIKKRFLIAFAALLSGFPINLRGDAPVRRPNVLMIAVDDLNHWVGYLGRNRQTITPNIDRLAASATSFSHSYCAAPVCNPSRAALMSGLRPDTSGVYGNCRGEWVPETRPLNPETARAVRRADAEMRLRDWGRTAGVAVSILRVPGIYAADRLPIERLKAGTPALAHESDPYTNHIHADDLARIVVATLLRGRAGRAYNASDDSDMRMGEYFDLVAEHFGLPRPPRVAWQEAVSAMPAQLLSFKKRS